MNNSVLLPENFDIIRGNWYIRYENGKVETNIEPILKQAEKENKWLGFWNNYDWNLYEMTSETESKENNAMSEEISEDEISEEIDEDERRMVEDDKNRIKIVFPIAETITWCPAEGPETEVETQMGPEMTKIEIRKVENKWYIYLWPIEYRGKIKYIVELYKPNGSDWHMRFNAISEIEHEELRNPLELKTLYLEFLTYERYLIEAERVKRQKALISQTIEQLK